MQSESKTHNNSTIIFDLHGVIFKLDKRLVVKELWSAPAKFRILLACCNPYFLGVALYLWFTTPVLEQFILAMMDRFPLIRPNKEAALRTANALKPIPETVELIHKLKLSGHKIYIFSNIGDQSLAMINTKFDAIMRLADGIMGTSQCTQYRAKPEREVFDIFIDRFQLDPTTTLFIDDKPRNLQAARRLGMAPVHFTSPASIARKLDSYLNH